MTRILALDLGTTTGWASHDELGGIRSGSVRFKFSRFEGGGMRFVKFRAWLRDHLGVDREYSARVEAVYFEAVRRHIGVDAAHAYGGYLGHLTALCEEMSIPYSGVPVGTIKKSFTGKGNASKEEMIAECRRRGFEPADDNEADAIAILLMHSNG